MAIDGVTGAVIAGKDGLVLASTLDSDDAEVLAAMAAAAFDASNRYLDQLRAGGVHQALFEARGGAYHVADAGDYLVVVRSALQASLGRIRFELNQASGRHGQRPNRY